MIKLKCALLFAILALSFSTFGATQIPRAEDITEFKANPIRENTYFKDFIIDRKDLEEIIKKYYQVTEDQWKHKYSHVAMEDRTGTIKLKDGQIIQWMVRPGGLATLTYPDKFIIYLAKEEPNK